MTEEIKKLLVDEVQPAVKSLTDSVKTHADNLDKVQKDLTEFKDKTGKELKEWHDEIMTKLNAPATPSEKETKDALAVKAEKAYNDYVRKGVITPELKGLSTDSDPAGGYLVNPNKANYIIERAVQYAPMLEIATVETISSGDYLDIPGEGSTAYSVATKGERESRTETTAGTFQDNKIFVYDYVASPRATQKMLDDNSYNLEAYTARKVNEQAMLTFAGDCVTGSGAGKPTGFTVPTLTNTVLSGSSGALAIATLPKLQMAVKPPYRRAGRWACNGTTLATIWGLAVSAYQPTMAWNPASGRYTLMGQDVIEMSELPNIGASAYPIYYGDWAQACTVVRRADITVLRDPYTNKPYVTFDFTLRYGFKVTNEIALAKMKSNNS